MHFIKKLFEIGAHRSTSYEMSRRIVLSNQLAFTFVSVSLPYTLIFPLLGSTFLGVLVLLVETTFTSTWLMNHWGHYRLARLWLIGWIIFWVFVFAYLVGQESGIQNILFTLVPVSYGLLEDEKGFLKTLFLGIPLGVFYLLEMLRDLSYLRIPLSDQGALVVYYTGTGFIFCILIMTIRFYSQVIHKSQATLDAVLRYYPLTQREAEIVEALSEGKNNRQISEALFIEETTVKNHLKNIYRKVQVKSRSELLSLLFKGAPLTSLESPNKEPRK